MMTEQDRWDDRSHRQTDPEPGFVRWLKRRPAESWGFFVIGLLIGAVLL